MLKKLLLNSLPVLLSANLLAHEGDKSWATNWQPSKVFIENKGQFPKVNDREIQFAIDHDRTKFYFSATGLTYAFFKSMPKKEENEHEREREKFKSFSEWQEKEKEERSANVKRDYVHLIWENSNPNVKIVAEEEASEYFSYALAQGEDVININYIKAFKKITYKNLYPNIDVEYVFHPTEGIKYSLILHPGADISLVKMKFTDANKVSVADNGDLHIRTGFGDIIDHAPATFYANNHSSVINSKFVKSGSTVSFQLDGYNNTQEVVVDPWTQTPTISNSNGVWECEKDGAGNVYIIGGDSPMKLLKYNSTGVLQWTYNTTWDTANYWLGTFATDLAGNSYVTAGSIARLQKVTTAAAMLYNVAGGSMDEYWNIAFNCDQTKLIIGGTRLVLGSGLSPVGNGVIFDINTNTGAVNSLQVVGKNRPGFLGIHDPEEVRSITASHNARYYFLTLDSIGAIDQNFNACSSSSANVLFNFNHTYAFGYKSEDWRPKGNGGIMSVRANKNFVYTQNGKTISKRSLMTGAIITTVNIPGGISTANLGTNQPGNSGIDIDSCGNVYVGSGNAVIKYDASLNLLSSTAVPFHVYDVAVSYGGNVIACGATGTSTTVSRTGSVQSINMGACDPSVLTCCDANVCNAGPFCISDPSYTLTPATAGGIWSGTGVNASGVFSPSTAGVGVHPIVYTLPCGSDSLFITVSACAALNVCINNGTLTVSGGTPTYTWSTQSTVTSCTACVIGCNFPPGCSTTVTSWTPAATGTTTFTPGSYPVLVQDGAGASYTITTAGSVPNCTVACVAPTLSVSAQTNVSCFGGTNGSATVVASPAGTYTYTWQNGNLNGASQSSLSAGIYTVTATNGGCSGTTTVNITQPAVLSAGAVQTSSVTCHGLSNGTASVSISGGTSTYTATWSGGGSGTSIGGLSAGVHTVTVTDAHNCVATSTVNITQPVDLVITPTATVAASCGSSNGSATVTASGGTGALTYSWSTGATGQVLSGVPGGTYTVTVTDANNCTNSAGIVITSAGGPTATASSASITCNGLSNGTASVNISGGTPNYTVTWSSGGSGTSVSGLPAGTYTATITDANNCVTTTTVSVVQPLPISITFTNNSPSACGASTGSVTANASGGTGVITYTWNTGASGQTLSNVPAGSYTVTATDANNCSHIASVNIVTVNGPTVTPVATASVNCNGASTGSASVNISGGTPSYTVSWSNGGSGTTVNGLPAGTYTVIVTDASSCVSNGTITISQPPAVTVTVNSSPTGCLGSTGTATASATGGTGVLTYSWSNSQTGTTASGLGQGVYTVTVTDANSCITTHTVQVGVTNPPVVAIDSSHNVKCNGQTNGSAYVSSTGGTPGYTYTWSNAQTGTVATNLGQGTYTVIVTDAGGCKDTATITINQPQPLKDTIVNIQPENCNHQNGGASVSVTGGTAPFTIQWSSGQTTSTVSNFPAGTYTVLVTDSKGCTATNSVTITSVPGPTLTLVGQSDVTCNGLSNGTATVIATGGTPNYTYNWSNGSTGAAVGGLSSGGYVVTVSDAASCTYTLGLVINQPGAININTTTTPVNCNGGHNGSATAAVSGGTSPYTVSWSNGQSGNVITNLSAGVYTVSVIDNHNCPKSTTIIITENPPVDTLSITGAICLNDPNVLLTAPHGGIAPDTIGSPYQWNLSNNPIPGANTYTYNGNTSAVNNYSVNWFYHGCRYVSTNVLVTVSQDFGMLPQTNVFTPNDDKINDEFLPFSLSALGGSSSHNTQLLASMIDDYELVIYDRWGVLLFKTTTVTDTWNGKTPDGKDVSAGTYYWIARYKAKCSKNPGEQNIKGFVQLIR